MLSRDYSPDVRALGDRIAALSAAQAARLNEYLAAAHRVEAVCSPTALPPDPDVIVEDGVAQAPTWAVVLEGVDPRQRIALIKFVREKLSLSLIEARNLVEGAPRVVKDHLIQSDAEALRAQLEAAGARVTLRTNEE
jgi:large subunit ribosomal protein L7/L12